jgi:hypothetical protein
VTVTVGLAEIVYGKRGRHREVQTMEINSKTNRITITIGISSPFQSRFSA